MELVLTKEPHFITGYTGHCPQYMYRMGKTYGNLTHELFVDPRVTHSPKIVVTNPNCQKPAGPNPPLEVITFVNRRDQEADAGFKHPIIPGYNGFIPRIRSQIGDRFSAAAIAGVAEHEKCMQQLKCECRNVQHKHLLESGQGVFGRNLKDISLQKAKYTIPLIPVQKGSEGVTRKAHSSDEHTRVPYSKHTAPHFMVPKDPEKYIMNGYGGHIPMAFERSGENNKDLTANALCEFLRYYQHRLNREPVPNLSECCEIYLRNSGLMPTYAGHVPGEMFRFGHTFGRSTTYAKRGLKKQL